MKEYLDIVNQVIQRGTRKENRTGIDTISAFGIHYTADMQQGFPLLTTKKIAWKNIVAENLWFLSGSPNIDLLRRHGCKFWEPWADDVGNVPSAYGHIWRNFPNGHKASNDQIAWAIRELQRNPMSRRIAISAWDPNNGQTSRLPPCHLLFILNVQVTPEGPTLNLHLTQRSCDIGLGVPYNLAGYAFLLHLFARFANLRPGLFSHTLVDAHIYTAKADGSMSEYDHLPGLQKQLKRSPRQAPQLEIDPKVQSLDDLNWVFELSTEDMLKVFALKDYDPHPAIKFTVAV